jgi:L-alanine-DL-glutamate epimerase-like enolase superfamily enzyme
MSAPVSISHAQVHSIRTRIGLEALVARVVTTEATGFGFALNLDAALARDMAAWDAAARGRDAPLYALLGGSKRGPVAITDSTSLPLVDPFDLGSLELTLESAGSRAVALRAPNGHPWEIAWCATIAAVLEGKDVKIWTPNAAPAFACQVPSDPGAGIDWSIEPGFSSIRWL